MAAPVSAFRRNAAGPMGVKLRLLLWEEQSRGRTCLEPAEMMGTLTPVPPEPGLQLMAAPPPPRTPAAPPRNTGQDLHHHRPKVFSAGRRSHTAASGISHMLSSMRFRAFDRLKYFGALQVSLVKALLLCLQLRRLVDAPCWSVRKAPRGKVSSSLNCSSKFNGATSPDIKAGHALNKALFSVCQVRHQRRRLNQFRLNGDNVFIKSVISRLRAMKLDMMSVEH